MNRERFTYFGVTTADGRGFSGEARWMSVVFAVGDVEIDGVTLAMEYGDAVAITPAGGRLRVSGERYQGLLTPAVLEHAIPSEGRRHTPAPCVPTKRSVPLKQRAS